MSTEYQTVGNTLIKARESLGYSINEIADYLKIRTSYLKALENDDFKSIPGNVYVIGFLRTYSDFLGLDAETLISLYKLEAKGCHHLPASQVPEAMKAEQKPSAMLVYSSLALMLLLFISWRIAAGSGELVLNSRSPEQIANSISGKEELKAQQQGLCQSDSAQQNQSACQTAPDKYHHQPSLQSAETKEH